MKLLILGHGRHGKDTVGDIFAEDFGLRTVSSSMFAAEEVVRPYLEREYGLTYATLEACYEDRHNNRERWAEAISDFNADDPTALTRGILAVSDIYVGLRNDREFYASRHLFDFVIGVVAFERCPALDPTFLCPLGECDYLIDNNGPEEDLRPEVHRIMARMVNA
jgi:hypothetical protein